MPNSVLGKLLTECLNTVGPPAYDEEDLTFANAIRATTPTKTESSGLLKGMFLPLLPAEQKVSAGDVERGVQHPVPSGGNHASNGTWFHRCG